jgi:hemin uptake protein HemP
MKQRLEMPACGHFATPAKATDEHTVREVRSEDLFNGSNVVLIRHADAIYTLRHTSNGKLILTK